VTFILAASVRSELAGFLSALLSVYVICIFAWIVLQMVLSFGLRLPYSRFTDGAMTFLRDVTEPYLRIFRPIPLRIGPIDLTPLVAILVLQLVGGIVIRAIAP
jgi:YggT family protein